MQAEVLAQERWRYGFVCVRPFVVEHAAYVAAYTVKKLTRPGDERLAPGQIPEFALMSRRPGVGVPGVDTWVRWLRTPEGERFLAEQRDVPGSVRIQGVVYPLGRTLRRHMRDGAGVSHDDPVRTYRREETYKALRRDPIASGQLERKRVARYDLARARAARARGSL